MERWVILFLAFLNLKAFAQDEPDSWVRIDCGANRSIPTNGILWQTDEAFIKTGTNYPIPHDSLKPLPILNTLRAFTEQNENCYTLPASTMTRFFLRAVFFYANYDGLSKPPTFDLQIDGNKWATIVSSITEVLYYEILYWSQSPTISVCLAQTQKDQFPFISSLEAWSVPDTMYTGTGPSQDLAWLNTYRYNYGPANGTIWYPDDSYNRIWEPTSVPGDAVNTTAEPGTSIFYHSNESPPVSVVLDAIEAQNGTSLFLHFNSLKTNVPIFIEAYFTEMHLSLSGTRSFDMYVDGKSYGTVKPEYYTCTAQPALVQSLTGNLTIELRPTETTSPPPIISAIEIYTASDPLVTNGTHQDNSDGQSSKDLIIVLAVGIPLCVIVILFIICYRKRARHSQNQTTGPGIGNGNENWNGNGYGSFTSTEQLIRPPRPPTMMEPMAEEYDDDIVSVSMFDTESNQQSTVPVAEEYDDDCIPVSVFDTESNQQSMVPDMDLDELEERVDQLANHEKLEC